MQSGEHRRRELVAKLKEYERKEAEYLRKEEERKKALEAISNTSIGEKITPEFIQDVQKAMGLI